MVGARSPRVTCRAIFLSPPPIPARARALSDGIILDIHDTRGSLNFPSSFLLVHCVCFEIPSPPAPQRVCVTFVTCVLTFSRACTPDMSLYVCVYIYMRARQTQVFMYVCMYRSHICRIMSHACQEYVEPPASEIRKHTPIDMCVCICMYVYTYVCMYVCMNVCMYVCMLYIYIYICIHTQTHTHRHTHTHTQKHTHMIYNSHTHKI